MISFKSFLIERSLEDIESKNPNLPKDVLKQIYDNLGEKYSRYVVPFTRLYMRSPYEISSTLELVNTITKNNITVDVNSMKSFDMLTSMVQEKLDSKGIDKSSILKAHNPYDNNLTPDKTVSIPLKGDSNLFPLVWKQGDWRIYNPTSLEGTSKYTPMKYIGWCTAGSVHCSQYINNGKLYVFIKGDEFRGQLFKADDSQRTEFMKPSTNPRPDGPAQQEAIDIDEFQAENPELKKFFKSIGITKAQVITFKGRRFPYTVEYDGDEPILVFETLDLSDMGLTSLMELPWNQPDFQLPVMDED